jgi:hypothetical protein
MGAGEIFWLAPGDLPNGRAIERKNFEAIHLLGSRMQVK